MTLQQQEQILKIQQILAKNVSGKKFVRKATKVSDRHIWTLSEEELALNLYLNKASESQIEVAVEGTAIKLSSMKMKLQNIAFIDTGVGLENVSNLTKQVYESYTKDKVKYGF